MGWRTCDTSVSSFYMLPKFAHLWKESIMECAIIPLLNVNVFLAWLLPIQFLVLIWSPILLEVTTKTRGTKSTGLSECCLAKLSTDEADQSFDHRWSTNGVDDSTLSSYDHTKKECSQLAYLNNGLAQMECKSARCRVLHRMRSW